jgi:hypothetical protein
VSVPLLVLAPPPLEAVGKADRTGCQSCGSEICEGHDDVISRVADGANDHVLRGLTLSQLLAGKFQPRAPILWRGDSPVLREGHLGAIVAGRGIGKTWLIMTLALIMAAGREALGFRAERPCRVLHVDGEMAGEYLQERNMRLVQWLQIPSTAQLTIIATDWQGKFLPRLDTQDGIRAIQPWVNDADVIILDNRSCLFDPEGEKDPTAWGPAQEWLLRLRQQGKTVLIGHHTNRQGSARGHSKAEDVLDVIIKLSRPEGYQADQGARFVLEFDKARSAHGEAVLPFTAHLTPDGWHVDRHSESTPSEKVLANVRRLCRAGERPKSANQAIRSAGVSRNTALDAFNELLDSGGLIRHPDGGFCVADA